MRVRLMAAIGVAILMAATGCTADTTTADAKTPVAIPSDPAAAFALAKSELGAESAHFALNGVYTDVGTDAGITAPPAADIVDETSPVGLTDLLLP